MSWFTTNFQNRLLDPSIDFQVTLKKSKFQQLSFEDAVNDVVLKIANSTDKKIFIGFSGGYDSELIVRSFHKFGINFYPILVELEGCEEERSYAYDIANELGLDLVVLKMSIQDYIRNYYEFIYKKLNGISDDVRPFICKYVDEKNGVFVDGGTLVGDGEEKVFDYEYYCREYPFYSSTLFPSVRVYNFFFHTPEIVVSMLNQADKDEIWAKYKERVFNLKYRPKMRGHIDSKSQDILDKIRMMRKHRPNTKYYFGKKEQLIDLILEK